MSVDPDGWEEAGRAAGGPGITQRGGNGGLALSGRPNSHLLLLWGSHPTFADSVKEETYVT